MQTRVIKDVGLLGAEKRNKDKGNLELTLSQNKLKTDKYMTTIPT